VLVGYTQLSACDCGQAAASGENLDAENELAGTNRGLNAYCQKSRQGWQMTKFALLIRNLRPERLSGRLEEWRPTYFNKSGRGTMHLYGIRAFEQQEEAAGRNPRNHQRKNPGQACKGLRALAAVMLTLAACMPLGFAQQASAGAAGPDKAASNLPSAPTPALTEPLDLRSTSRDFSQPAGHFLSNPINMYRPTSIAKASFANSVRLTDLVKDGKIYLSLSDALALALENNYDIAIARYNLDIADTDILRAKAGSTLRGVDATVLTNTLGGGSQTLSSSGAPGGASSGAAAGSSGLVLSTDGVGPAPEALDPTLTGNVQLERTRVPSTSPFSGGSSNTNTYDFSVGQGFVTGSQLTVAWNQSRVTNSNGFSTYSPLDTSVLRATLTQHLLQGAGIWVNKRFQYEAGYNRRLTDSTFRQQILYTVNQVENIYWALVSSYEDVQAKQRALEQSTRLESDDRKQLEIGTVAPLQVVSDQSAVATDQQALINSQNNLSYQQLIIKQAIARNLNDPALVTAPVIPTDRISVEELPEEKQPVEELVQQAFQNRPELEQAVLAIKKDAITLRGARNNLLPTLDAYAFYSGTGEAGTQNPNALCESNGQFAQCPANDPSIPPVSYGTSLDRMLNNTFPDKGVGFNLSIPLRNRTAQADQARSLIEYRQAELHLEQLYTQIHMQVVNAQIALTNDRELVKSSLAAREFNQQSLDAEVKKLHLGASTTANVLQQERNLATAENNQISAQAIYAQARAALYQMLASTLQHYGINLNEAASGQVNTTPVVPGVQPAPPSKEPSTTPPAAQ
jgi:outer membrane protein TolC